jgi:hypothetical protein
VLGSDISETCQCPADSQETAAAAIAVREVKWEGAITGESVRRRPTSGARESGSHAHGLYGKAIRRAAPVGS